MDRKLRAEVQETQKKVKEAALSLQKAADKAAKIAKATKEEIRHRMAGNLCRCGTYTKIEEAIRTWRD